MTVKNNNLYETLSDLMVLVHHHGAKDMRFFWAVNPERDGLVTCFNNGAGRDNSRNLSRAASRLSDDFHKQFTSVVQRTLPDNKTIKQTVIDSSKISDDAVRAYWPEAKELAEAMITRLQAKDKNVAENMRKYYLTANNAFTMR